MLHLTDQYFVSHTSYNCTDIFQRGRIQGKYTDNPNLIFWTTTELVETINEYVNFITKIEAKIMSLPRGHEYIRNLCEINLVHKEFIKTLGRPKQRKNLESKCIKYDRKNNALIYSFPPNLKPKKYEEEFSNWCKEQGIEFNGFINRLEISDEKEYLENEYVINYELSEHPNPEKFKSINEYYNYVETHKLPNKIWASKLSNLHRRCFSFVLQLDIAYLDQYHSTMPNENYK